MFKFSLSTNVSFHHNHLFEPNQNMVYAKHIIGHIRILSCNLIDLNQLAQEIMKNPSRAPLFTKILKERERFKVNLELV